MAAWFCICNIPGPPTLCPCPKQRSVRNGTQWQPVHAILQKYIRQQIRPEQKP